MYKFLFKIMYYINNRSINMVYKLRSWIPKDKINWKWLSSNPAAIHLLEQNQNKIYWLFLSHNPSAIHL